MGEVLVKVPRVLSKVPRPRLVTNQPPLPAWLEPRDYQLDAVERVVKAYRAGAKVVMLDAPTGTGKTAIGELVRREMGVARGLYVCTTKSLQDQVARDFEYARVLKGRVNYLPTRVDRRDSYSDNRAGLDVSCADCDRGPQGEAREDQECSYCDPVDCPYLNAQQEARDANLGVLNTAYLLAEANGRGVFAGRGLVIADEADLLEEEMLRYVELRVTGTMARELGVEAPKKGSHMTTIRAWLEGEVLDAIETRRKGVGGGLEGRRKARRLDKLREDVKRVIAREGGWVREGGEEEGERGSRGHALWRHADRWLLMSGTTVSADMQADALGIEDAGVSWDVVEVESQFQAETRRVVYVPAGNMTRKGQEAGGREKVMVALGKVLEKHPTGNVLVHTFSYSLAQETVKYLTLREGDTRPVITYTHAGERDRALGVFRAAMRNGTGAVLVASSMDRGVDLPGDLCRVQVVMKVPMASLGSRQVGERLKGPGGELWYLVGTCRTLMQMCGRIVRGKDDWGVTYVLDQHFSKVLKDGKRRGCWPGWWLEGLETGKLREYV